MRGEGTRLHADQHLDRQENVFFQRVEWEPAEKEKTLEESSAFERMARNELGMHARMALSHDCPKVAVMVSKADHCFHDLVLRVRAGEWKASFAGVLSNHEDLRPVSENYGMPFRAIPLPKRANRRWKTNNLPGSRIRVWNW